MLGAVDGQAAGSGGVAHASDGGSTLQAPCAQVAIVRHWGRGSSPQLQSATRKPPEPPESVQAEP
jgi:hypothetical protein